MANEKSESVFNRLIKYLLVHQRWLIVCPFLLPLSFFYDWWVYFRSWIIFTLNSAPKNHDRKVAKIQKQIREWIDSGMKTRLCTARPGWQTMSFRQPLYKKTFTNINVNLVDILEIDKDKMTVRCEPLVTMGQLTKLLNPQGYTIPVVPELDDLTVGGLVMGTGVESSSHLYGLVQHFCLEYEIILSDASVITVTKESDPDLFYSIPWSYGTLGLLASVRFRIIPCKRYVKLEYEPIEGLDKTVRMFDSASRDQSNDFVECLLYEQEKGVLMRGKMVSKPEPDKVNNIGSWYKPWFYKHAETAFNRGKFTDYMPLRDYYHRHSRALFWEIKEIIPFGNNFLFRLLFGWLLPVKVSLLKLTQTEGTRELYENNHIIQDLLIPIETLADTIRYFEKQVKVYPVWLCPFRLDATQPGLVSGERSLKALGPSEDKHDKRPIFVDVGVYGVPAVKNFQPETTTRNIEAFVRKCHGFQMLYADTYMTKEEFRQMFDHKLYDRVRKRLNASKAFPEVYDKVNRYVRK